MRSIRSNQTFRRILQIGGIVAGVIMVAFGVAAIYMGFDGRSTVSENLGNEFIVGSDDMNQSAIGQEINTIIKPSQENIAAERKKAGVEPIEFTPSWHRNAGRGREDRRRHRRPVLRGVSPSPRVSIDEWADLLTDGSLRREGRRPSRGDGLCRWHEQRGASPSSTRRRTSPSTTATATSG